MRFLILIITYLFFFPACFSATNRKIDSLYKLYQKSTHDTVKINLLIDLAESYRTVNADSAVLFAKEALRLADSANYYPGRARSTYQLATVFRTAGKYREAMLQFRSSLTQFQELRKTTGIANSYLGLAQIHCYLYDINLDTSRYYYKQALHLFKLLNNKKGIANVYSGLADNYRYKSDFKVARSLYDTAILIHKEIGDDGGTGTTYHNRGLAYLDQGIYLSAIEDIHQALQYYDPEVNRFECANSYLALAQLYANLYDYETAMKYIEQSIGFFLEKKNNLYLAGCYETYGYIYEDLGKDSMALEYYLKMLECEIESGNDYNEAYAYLNIARMYLKLYGYDSALVYYQKSGIIGEKYADLIMISRTNYGQAKILKMRGETGKAIKLAEKAFKQAKEINDIEGMSNTSEILAQLYASAGRYRQAYEFNVLYKEYSDSLFNEKNVRRSTALEYEYRMEKERKENKLIENQKQKLHESELKKEKIKRIYLITLAIVLSVLIGLVYHNYQTKKKDNLLLSKQKKALTEANATKDKFFSILAHDLINPINAVMGISRIFHLNYNEITSENRRSFAENIHLSISNIYKILKDLLDWSRTQTGNIAFEPSEFALVDVLYNLSKLNNDALKNKQLNLHISVNEKLIVYADYQMISVILRNLIVNAIKFSFQEGDIYIDAQNEGTEYVKISVRDHGTGISDEHKDELFKIDKNTSTLGTNGETGTGLGLILCKEFVEKNGGEIGVESKEGKGSIFWFTLPAKAYGISG